MNPGEIGKLRPNLPTAVDNRPGARLELPSPYRVPVSWIRTHAPAVIRWRTVRDVLPAGAATDAVVEALKAEVLQQKEVLRLMKKQKGTGTWGDNILGVAPSKAQGIKDVGTVAAYRRLVEMGVGPDQRAFRLADRVLYRLLSRDEDPALLFEFQRAAKGVPELAQWARAIMRQGATAALAHAGYVEDPRVRGAAHRTASDVSNFLRSELAEKPFVRKGAKTVLHPEAQPPTLFSVATVSYMPSLQRERAGFVDRLAQFLAHPAPKKAWAIQVGRKTVHPQYHLLGDPLQADSSGHPKDLALSLHWIELLIRLGALKSSPTASRILARLLEECDANGVWNPKNLRTLPKSPSKLADFAFPIDTDGKTPESRQAEITFRLAHLAKLAGSTLEFV